MNTLPKLSFIVLIFLQSNSALPDKNKCYVPVFCVDGKKAFEVMTSSEKNFIESKLLRIKAFHTESDINEIIGTTPARSSGSNRPVWLGPDGKRESQIPIYFSNGEVIRVRWGYVGRFIWQNDP